MTLLKICRLHSSELKTIEKLHNYFTTKHVVIRRNTFKQNNLSLKMHFLRNNPDNRLLIENWIFGDLHEEIYKGIVLKNVSCKYDVDNKTYLGAFGFGLRGASTQRLVIVINIICDW